MIAGSGRGRKSRQTVLIAFGGSGIKNMGRR